MSELSAVETFRSLRQRASAGGYPNWTADECEALVALAEKAHELAHSLPAPHGLQMAYRESLRERLAVLGA